MSSTLAVEAGKLLDMFAPEAWTDSAGQPSLQDMNTHNVTSPAHETSFKTLKDLRQWLHHLSEPDQSSAPVCRVRNALGTGQALIKDWDIKQKESPGNKRSLLDVQQRLSSAVLAEGSRLRSLTRSAGSLTSHANFERMFRNGEASLDLNATARARSRSNRKHISIDYSHHTSQRSIACMTVRSDERLNCKSRTSASSHAQPAGVDMSAA